MVRTTALPPYVEPCDCPTKYVHRSTDGISDCYCCASCRQLLADLVIGAEP